MTMDAMRCPTDDADVTKDSPAASEQQVALLKMLLDQPRTIAAGRADHSRRRVGVHGSKAIMRNYPGAILIVTHEAYFSKT